jgi:predicted flavoprotein YhiN
MLKLLADYLQIRLADERKKMLNNILKQALYISKVRRHFLDEKIDHDDFSNLKKEHSEKLCQLNNQLNCITQKLAGCALNNDIGLQ